MKHFLLIAWIIAYFFASSQILVSQDLNPVEIDSESQFCRTVRWIAFYPDSAEVAYIGCADRISCTDKIMRWRLFESDVLVTIPDSSSTRRIFPHMFSFNSDSSRAVSAGRLAVVWDTETWEDIMYLPRFGHLIYGANHVLYTPDDKEIVMLTWDGIKVLDGLTGELIREIGDQSRYPKRGMDISPDGTRLVVSTDSGDVWMYDYQSGERIWEIKRNFPVYNVQFSQNGRRVLLTGFAVKDKKPISEAVEYSSLNGEKLSRYIGHTSYVYSARYNRAGTQIITTSFDSTARIWSTETGEELAVINYGARGYWAEFSAGGTWVAIAGDNGVSVWDLQPTSSVSEPVAQGGSSSLGVVHPNPAHAVIEIPFGLQKYSEVRLCLYDALGKEIGVVAEGGYEAGEYQVLYNVAGLPSGLYVIALHSEGEVRHQQIHIIR